MRIKNVEKREFPLELRGMMQEDPSKNEFTLNGRPCHAVILCMAKDNSGELYQIEVGEGKEVISMVASALLHDSGIFGVAQAVASSQRLKSMMELLSKVKGADGVSQDEGKKTLEECLEAVLEKAEEEATK